MMTHDEREHCIDLMAAATCAFYSLSKIIGNHPFIEFTGLLNEYIKICRRAHDAGVDFSDCSGHTGIDLPLSENNIRYINEKLECIFGGRISIRLAEPLGT